MRRILYVVLPVLMLAAMVGAVVARPGERVLYHSIDDLNDRVLTGNCVQGTQPLMGIYRVFLPLVKGSTSGPPACATEIEINDTHSAAQVITARCVRGRAASSSDPDWYALGVCSPVTLTVHLNGPANTDLDLYLHGDPPGAPIAASERSGANEMVSARLITGVYYSLVQPALGPGTYTLTFEAHR